MTDSELLQQYWDAQAQFGPFEVGPEEFLRISRLTEVNCPETGKLCKLPTCAMDGCLGGREPDWGDRPAPRGFAQPTPEAGGTAE